MTTMFNKGLILLGPVLIGSLACSEVQDTNPIAPAAVVGSPTPVRGELTVCKIGADGSFSLDVNGVSQGGFALTDGQCALVWSSSGPAVDVMVTELPSTATLDSIVGIGIRGSLSDPTGIITQITIVGSSSATVKVGLEYGAVLTFYNTAPPPPPIGGEGCTPGYWKQSQHFNNWTAPYTPSTQFSAVFENAFPGQTLLQVLKNNGNTTGLDALGRHTVAALLNAASSGVNYDLTVADVINQFNAVYPGTKTAYIAQKDSFEAFNQQGCPLN